MTVARGVRGPRLRRAAVALVLNGMASRTPLVDEEPLTAVGHANQERRLLAARVAGHHADVGHDVLKFGAGEGAAGDAGGVHPIPHAGHVVPHGRGHQHRGGPSAELGGPRGGALTGAGRRVASLAASRGEELLPLDRIACNVFVLRREQELDQVREFLGGEPRPRHALVPHRSAHPGLVIPHRRGDLDESSTRGDLAEIRTDGSVAESAYPVASGAALAGEHFPVGHLRDRWWRRLCPPETAGQDETEHDDSHSIPS